MGLLTKVGKAGDSLRSSCGPHWYLLKSWTSLRLGLATDESRQFQTHPRGSPKLAHASRSVLQFNVIKQAGYVPSDIHPLGCSPGEVGSSVRRFVGSDFFAKDKPSYGALVPKLANAIWAKVHFARRGVRGCGAIGRGHPRATPRHEAQLRRKVRSQAKLGNEIRTLNTQHSTFNTQPSF